MKTARKTIVGLVVTLTAVLVCLVASPGRLHAAEDVHGDWHSNWGDVTFYQDEGEIHGTLDGIHGTVYLLGSFANESRLRLWVKGQIATGWATLQVLPGGDKIKGLIKFDGHAVPVRWKLWK